MEPLDLPAVVLALVARTFGSSSRVEWGRAMLGELARVEGKRARWRFVLGCTRAIVVTAPGRAGSAWIVLAVVGAGVVASLGLVGYAFARYPQLRLGASTWLYLALFVVALAGYLVASVAAVRNLGRGGRSPLRVGIIGGVVIAALCIVIGVGATLDLAPETGNLLMGSFVVAALAVGAAGSWYCGRASAGREAALLAGVMAGLGVFMIWVGETLVTAGPPHDTDALYTLSSTMGVFSTNQPTVDDSIGDAMVLLVLIPLLVTAVGYLGSLIGRRPT